MQDCPTVVRTFRKRALRNVALRGLFAVQNLKSSKRICKKKSTAPDRRITPNFRMNVE